MNSTASPVTDQIVSLATNQSSAPENCRRKGKIARLPKAVRDMINHMLDDGLPYPISILSTIRNFADSGLRYAKVHQLERQQTAGVQGAPTASSQIKVVQA